MLKSTSCFLVEMPSMFLIFLERTEFLKISNFAELFLAEHFCCFKVFIETIDIKYI